MPCRDLPYGDRFRLTLLTDDPRRAMAADRARADRIGIDRERLGKLERQTGHDSRISTHDWEDLAAVAKVVERARLFVRLNPPHAGTECEVETALSLGARVLMLPGVRASEDVAAFVALVRGRALVSVLIELAPAVVRIREILDTPGIDEVMIGLNDLHLQLGAANHFEILASPVVEMLAAETHRKRLPLSIGGIGRAGDESLPIPADLVYAQYPRLGATGAWVARAFDRDPAAVPDYAVEFRRLRDRLTHWSNASPEALEEARAELARRASAWSRARRAPRLGRMSNGRVYCTDFDSNYLARGVAMLRSLRRFDACATIQVLALDDECAKAVSGIFGSAVSVVTAEALHDRFPQLRPLAGQRSRWALYATEKPAAALYALEQASPSAVVAFVDADTWFFSDPSPIFAELGPASIGVSPHRYPPEIAHLAAWGEFNAGCILWRNDETGRRCVRDWVDDCVECCAEELDVQGRYMNQGYLTRWPERYVAVRVLRHPGVNVAPWNVDRHVLRSNGGGVTVDGEALILYHFSGLVPDENGVWHSHHAYRHCQLELLRESVYGPYLAAVEAERRMLRCSHGIDGAGSVRAAPEGRGVMTFRATSPGEPAPSSPEDAELEAEGYRRGIRALVDAGMFEAALTVLRTAGPPPHSPRAEWEYYVAFCLHSLGREPDAALHHYAAALELGYDEFWIRFHRGELLVQLDRKADGLRELERARELRPDHAGLVEYLRWISAAPETLWDRLRRLTR